MSLRFTALMLFTCLLGITMSSTGSFAQAPAPQELLETPDQNAAPQTQPEATQPIPGMLDPDIARLPDQQDLDENALPFENYSDIPDEALADAQDFYEYCKTDYIMSSHMDCRCMGSRYLEERIKAGPEAPRQEIMLTLSGPICLSVEGAAGYGYKKCQENGLLTYGGGMTPEEYCECTGRNYAIGLQNSTGIITKSKLSGTMTTAYLRCRPSPPGNTNIFRRLDQQ